MAVEAKQEVLLQRVAAITSQILQLQKIREGDIVKASKAGLSTRRIGEAAGMNHETVRQLIRSRS